MASGALLNITGTTENSDPSFRYKMPRLVAKIEGRGNGIKTVVVNMSDIADAINRPAVRALGFRVENRQGKGNAAYLLSVSRSALLPRRSRFPPNSLGPSSGRRRGGNPRRVTARLLATERCCATYLLLEWRGVLLASDPLLQVEKATVNGAHTAADLQKLLNVFIDKFVLCPNCKLPETALVVKKGIIFHRCSACGAREVRA